MGNRVRTQGGIRPATTLWYAGASNDPGTYVLGVPHGVGGIRIMNDITTPGFVRKRAEGYIVNNPMSSYFQSYERQYVSCSWTHPSYGSPHGWAEHGEFAIEYHGEGPDDGHFSDSLAKAAAINQANANVNPSYAMLAVTVAEIGQAKEMFRNIGLTAASFRNAMVVAARSLRGKYNSPRAQREAMQAIANSWLQVRYGWLPLVYEMNGIVKSLNEPRHDRQTSRGRATVKSVTSGELVHDNHGPFGSKWRRERTAEYRAGVMYESTSTVSENLASRLGLSASDALTVPWELVRLSFVVDWFIDIGDWLRAISPKPGVNPLASWTTSTFTHVYTHDGFWASPTGGWSCTASGGSSIHTRIDKVREPSASPTIPGYGSGMTLNRSIDAAMLSLQSLKGVLHDLSHLNSGKFAKYTR